MKDSQQDETYVLDESKPGASRRAKVAAWLKSRNGKIAAIGAAGVLLVGGTAAASVISASVSDSHDVLGQFGDGHAQPRFDGHGPDGKDGDFQGGPGHGPGFQPPAGDPKNGPDHGPHHGPDGGDDDQFKPPADGQLTPTPAPSSGSKS